MSEIRTWKKERVRLSDVKPMPDNSRTISSENMEALKVSMRRFGYVEPIVFNQTTGHIIGGHQRYSILLAEGVKEAVMVVVEISADEELAANITLNNPEIQGKWDDTAIDLMGQLEDSVPELFDSLRIGELRKFVQDMSQGQQDKVPIVTDDFDTECPCCGLKWKIGAGDIANRNLE